MNWNIEYFDELASTNDTARGHPHGDVVAAARQTAGRGQRGNSWSSEKGLNLTFSVALEPVFLAAARQFLLSEAVALAVADALGDYGLAAAVKWPNDIYVGDRKIAGILIENDVRGSAIGRSVVGIGLNVNQSAFDPSLPNPTSMRLAAGREYDTREVLDVLLGAFSRRYAMLAAGDAEGVEADYGRRLYRKGIAARYALPDGTAFTGTIRGAEPSGELLIECADGAVRRFLFKEIEFV